MATPDRLRRAVQDLAALANVDVAKLFRQIDTADELREALYDLLPSLIAVYGDASATVAADWYDDHRVELGVRGSFSAYVPARRPDGAAELARWGIGPLFSATPDKASAQTLVSGGLQRRIANAARDVITGSSVADPFSDGWQRVGSGSCAFCRMLIARGAVYSETSVDFASHDHCDCGAAPAFSGEPRPVKAYKPSSRNISDSDRARVREFIAGNDL